jgi:hypothetical protein
MRIGKYDIPDEIANQGWIHSGNCNCNGLYQLRFRHNDYRNYELRCAPSFIIRSPGVLAGKCIKLLHYRVRVAGWFTPEQLAIEMQKVKDKMLIV